jgi:IS5 family transposase
MGRALPIEVRELPGDLAALDGLLSNSGMLAPIAVLWRAEFEQTGRQVIDQGRPAVAMEAYVRLIAEVSDSIHLRRFCRISLAERVPDESTIRKLTRRIGAETVNKFTRVLILEATRCRRLRPRAVRIDSTVIEADVKYPDDSGLAAQGVRALAREGAKLADRVKEKKRRVRDRSRSMGRTLRAVTRTIRRRSGEAQAEALALTEKSGELLESRSPRPDRWSRSRVGGHAAGARRRN